MGNQPTKLLDKALKISLIAGILIMALSSTYYLITHLPNKETSKPFQEPLRQVSEEETKKQALADVYNKTLIAIENNDFSTLYELSAQSLKNNITKDQFIAIKKANSKESLTLSKITTANIQIDQNIGIVTNCLSEDDIAYEWLKQNPDHSESERIRKKLVDIGYMNEQNEKLKQISIKECSKDDLQLDKYEYINNKWQILDPKVSERALKTANYVYATMSNKQQKEIINVFGEGFENSNFAIHNFTVFLDSNLEKLVQYETLAEKHKVASSKPIVNYEMPTIHKPSSQLGSSPLRCRSYTISGDYIYTDCN